jgi:hypothetical protein
VWCHIPIIQAIQEAEIRKIRICSQMRQKDREIPISTNKPGIMVNICNPSYTGGIEGGLWFRPSTGKKHEILSKN